VPRKILKDVKIWKMNDFSIHIELYDSEIIIKDENENVLRISKKEPLSIILDLIGSFKSQ
jgi:hypothetical protein